MKKFITVFMLAAAMLLGCSAFAFADEGAFTDGPMTVDPSDIQLEHSSYIYNGDEMTPAVTIDGLVEGLDFYVEYYDNTEAGIATAAVTGTGDYDGMYFELQFVIKKKNIADYAFVYTHNLTNTRYYVKAPQLLKGIDYTYTYTFDEGAVSIVVKGKGNYTGTVKHREKATYVNYVKSSAAIYQYRNLKTVVTIHNPRTGTTVYKSSNTSIATVTQKGTVTGKRPGTAYITVKNNGVSDKIKIVVKAPKLSYTNLKLRNSNGKALTYYGGTGKVTWKSSNSAIATVSSKGYVKGKKAGTCYVYGTRNGKKLKCTVKVLLGNQKYTSIPDFGAYIGKFRSYWSYEDGIYMAMYKATKSQMTTYQKKLVNSGFRKIYGGKDGIGYVNKNMDMAIVVYEDGIVGVGYTNYYDMDNDGASHSTLSVTDVDYSKLVNKVKKEMK